MNQIQISSLPVSQCKISPKHFDDLFLLSKKSQKNGFIFPFLAEINRDGIAEVLIDGRRFQKVANNYSEIPLYLLPKNISKLEKLELVTDYYLIGNDLNIYIKSRLLHYINNLDAKESRRYISRRLNLAPKPKIINKIKQFQRLKWPLVDFLLQKNAPLKTWEFLSNYTEDEQPFFIDLIEQTHPSLSNFRTIVEQLSELGKIQEMGLQDLITKIGLDNVFDETDTKNQLNKIKNIVAEARFPTISKTRKLIASEIDHLKPPKTLKITYDKSLERKELRGFFIISSEKNIDEIKQFFKAKKTQQQLQTLLKKL